MLTLEQFIADRGFVRLSDGRWYDRGDDGDLFPVVPEDLFYPIKMRADVEARQLSGLVATAEGYRDPATGEIYSAWRAGAPGVDSYSFDPYRGLIGGSTQGDTLIGPQPVGVMQNAEGLFYLTPGYSPAIQVIAPAYDSFGLTDAVIATLTGPAGIAAGAAFFPPLFSSGLNAGGAPVAVAAGEVGAAAAAEVSIVDQIISGAKSIWDALPSFPLGDTATAAGEFVGPPLPPGWGAGGPEVVVASMPPVVLPAGGAVAVDPFVALPVAQTAASVALPAAAVTAPAVAIPAALEKVGAAAVSAVTGSAINAGVRELFGVDPAPAPRVVAAQVPAGGVSPFMLALLLGGGAWLLTR